MKCLMTVRYKLSIWHIKSTVPGRYQIVISHINCTMILVILFLRLTYLYISILHVVIVFSVRLKHFHRLPSGELPDMSSPEPTNFNMVPKNSIRLTLKWTGLKEWLSWAFCGSASRWRHNLEKLRVEHRAQVHAGLVSISSSGQQCSQAVCFFLRRPWIHILVVIVFWHGNNTLIIRLLPN